MTTIVIRARMCIKKKRVERPSNYIRFLIVYQPIAGAVSATSVVSAVAKSSGKL